MIAASYFFYACFDWRYCLLLAGASVLNYLFSTLIYSRLESPDSRRFVAVAVVCNLLLLGFFKYYNFFADSLNGIITRIALFGYQSASGAPAQIFHFPFVAVALPAGISFYTFKAISLQLDIHAGTVRKKPELADVLLYISFFPQIASGPIVQADAFIPSIEKSVSAGAVAGSRPVDFSSASLLLMSGLLKKMVFANFLSVLLVEPVFADPAKYCGWEVFLAGVGYASVIYCDFSGYSDMAIGVALLLGFSTPKNFDRPYSAFSVSEFWRRWHMSLSSWLRKYVYFSMGGSRHGLPRTVLALLVTMFASGLWHGASWIFVLWGMMQGVAMVFERLLGIAKAPHMRTPVRCVRVAGTFLFTVAGWVVFRSATLADAGAWFKSLLNTAETAALAGRAGDSPVTWLVAVLLAVSLGVHAVPDCVRRRGAVFWGNVPLVLKGVCIAAFCLGVSAVSMSGVAPFIYFSF